jgi:hypothetical protein
MNYLINIACFVFLLLVMSFGSYLGRSAITDDCKEMGMFRNSNGVYVCELRKAQK